MAANLKFVFLIIFQMCCCCIQGFDLKGDIKFEGEDVPKRFPPGSYLIVKVEDNSLADAPSKVLARIENPINSKDFQKKKTLSYKISVKEPGKDVKRVSISAVINVGWRPLGDEWLRKGDYLTQTHQFLEISSNETSYVENIKVRKYS